jgi:hypothetical protein
MIGNGQDYKKATHKQNARNTKEIGSEIEKKGNQRFSRIRIGFHDSTGK